MCTRLTWPQLSEFEFVEVEGPVLQIIPYAQTDRQVCAKRRSHLNLLRPYPPRLQIELCKMGMSIKALFDKAAKRAKEAEPTAGQGSDTKPQLKKVKRLDTPAPPADGTRTASEHKAIQPLDNITSKVRLLSRTACFARSSGSQGVFHSTRPRLCAFKVLVAGWAACRLSATSRHTACFPVLSAMPSCRRQSSASKRSGACAICTATAAAKSTGRRPKRQQSYV